MALYTESESRDIARKFMNTLIKLKEDENISWEIMLQLLTGCVVGTIRNRILEDEFKDSENNYKFYKICLEFTEKLEDLALKMERDAEKDEN